MGADYSVLLALDLVFSLLTFDRSDFNILIIVSKVNGYINIQNYLIIRANCAIVLEFTDPNFEYFFQFTIFYAFCFSYNNKMGVL